MITFSRHFYPNKYICQKKETTIYHCLYSEDVNRNKWQACVNPFPVHRDS